MRWGDIIMLWIKGRGRFWRNYGDWEYGRWLTAVDTDTIGHWDRYICQRLDRCTHGHYVLRGLGGAPLSTCGHFGGGWKSGGACGVGPFFSCGCGCGAGVDLSSRGERRPFPWGFGMRSCHDGTVGGGGMDFWPSHQRKSRTFGRARRGGSGTDGQRGASTLAVASCRDRTFIFPFWGRIWRIFDGNCGEAHMENRSPP